MQLNRSAYILTSLFYDEKSDNSSWSTLSNLLDTCNIPFSAGNTLPAEPLHYYFIDMQGVTDTGSLPRTVHRLLPSARVMPFNMDPSEDMELDLLLEGYCGVLYREDPVDRQLKGLQQVMQGKRWFKRKTMDNALDKTLKHTTVQAPQANYTCNPELESLTKREKTIISLVSSGAKNQEIADKLHISPNTVKTHIYSIFKKTNSRNRVDLIKRSGQIPALG